MPPRTQVLGDRPHPPRTVAGDRGSRAHPRAAARPRPGAALRSCGGGGSRPRAPRARAGCAARASASAKENASRGAGCAGASTRSWWGDAWKHARGPRAAASLLVEAHNPFIPRRAAPHPRSARGSATAMSRLACRHVPHLHAWISGAGAAGRARAQAAERMDQGASGASQFVRCQDAGGWSGGNRIHAR